MSPALAGGFFTASVTWEAQYIVAVIIVKSFSFQILSQFPGLTATPMEVTRYLYFWANFLLFWGLGEGKEF